VSQAANIFEIRAVLGPLAAIIYETLHQDRQVRGCLLGLVDVKVEHLAENLCPELGHEPMDFNLPNPYRHHLIRPVEVWANFSIMCESKLSQGIDHIGGMQMNYKKRHWLLIAIVVLMLAMLACSTLATTTTPTEAEHGWRIVPTDTPVLTETPIPTDTPVATVCTLNSSYVTDVTIPDNTQFLPGTAFVKTWRIKNTSSCDWKKGTKLVYVSGDTLSGPPEVDVSPTAVGSNVDISVDFVSPDSPGTYRSNWQVQGPDGTKFGQKFYVQIVVPEPTATPTNTPQPTETPLPTATPTNTPLPTLKALGDWPVNKTGDEGPEVYALQYLLRAEGYSLTADGEFGPKTASTVKNFQEAKGLTIDGIVGPDTWQALIQGHTVKKGSVGEAVWAVQHLLKYKHGQELAPDGVFGDETDAAVRNLQTAYGLKVDGIVGKNTWKALVAD
jgi:peptidoglycan hydrolase-like protein with peptidoglycan-binding domain